MSDTFPEFAPRAPWWGPDLQTIRNAIAPLPVGRARSDAHAVERVVLPLDDGTGDALAASVHRPLQASPAARPTIDLRASTDVAPARPTAVLVHGLGGDEDSPYMHATARALGARGYPVVRLNLRGAGRSRPLCRREYHAGRTEDLRGALRALGDPTGAGWVLVGYSLGANMVLKLAGEDALDPGPRAYVAVSAPIDLAAASRRFLARRNRPYHWMLLRRLKQQSLAPEAGRSPGEHEIIRAVRSVHEFDERVTAPGNGYSCAAEYYAKNSAQGFLGRIRAPTLLIHALDDPWIPAEAYRTFPFDENPALHLLLARGGGHLGFHGRGAPIAWHDRCLLIWLDRALERGQGDRSAAAAPPRDRAG